MRSLVAVLLLALAALPLTAAVETWSHATLVDTMCAGKIKDNPDAHTRECALHCGAQGMGILTADGTFLKFDAPGNKQALALLKASTQKDHLRATVVGELSGDTIRVKSVKLD